MMALFDGEADESQAQRARAHLLVCQICAHRWLDWNRSRDLLRAVPVPAPPPTLLWRVLMACRLAALAPNRGRKIGASSLQAEKARAPFAPRDLNAQILARTTRVESPSPRAARRTMRLLALPSLAVPALAIWMIALQRDSFIPLAPPENPTREVAPRRAAPPLLASVSRPQVAPRSSHLKSTAPARLAAAPLPPLAPPRALRVRVQEAATSIQPAKRGAETSRIAPLRAVRAAPILVALSPAYAPIERPRAALQVKPLTPRVTAATRRSIRPLVAVKPARLSASTLGKSAPSLRAARWKTSTPRLVNLVEKTSPETLPSRVALPSAPPRIAALASPRLVAENADADDEQVEATRSVVEDFRAALAPDGFQTVDFDGETG